MNHTNEDGMNVLEAAIFLVFSRSDERFVMFLMENMYGIKKYLLNCNDEGWLPIFRVLHLF